MNPGFVYRWREVSRSELSKLFEALAAEAAVVLLGHEIVEGCVIMAQWSTCLVCKLSPRESEWSAEELGLAISDWIENFAGSKCLIEPTLWWWWSVSDNIFRSCCSSLLSFTFCNCLNLSCKRAMEELTTVGSELSLPIENRVWWTLKPWRVGGVFVVFCYIWCWRGKMHWMCLYSTRVVFCLALKCANWVFVVYFGWCNINKNRLLCNKNPKGKI